MIKNLMEVFVEDLSFLSEHNIDYIGTYIDHDYAVAALDVNDYHRLMDDLYDEFETADLFSIITDCPWLTDNIRAAADEVTLDFAGFQVLGWAPKVDVFVDENGNEYEDDTEYHPEDHFVFCMDINDWVYDIMGAENERQAQQLIFDLAYSNNMRVSDLLWQITYANKEGENND